ncbi:MAG: translation elongation factor Ts [Bacillota bacterium]|nr:translation elongation factor Ts [Bacillota bacterium]
MVNFSANDVKDLRERTGAGMMDCKRALTEAEGDVEKAIDLLREKGLAAAAKKAGRIAAEGLVGMAFAEDGTQAAMVEVNSETDFVAKNPEFVDFVAAVAKAALGTESEELDALLAAPCEDTTVGEALTAKIAKIGENMSVRRFVHMAGEGKVYASYTHGNGKIGVLVEMETAAAAAEVAEMGRDVAMQIASMSPLFVSEADVDPEYLEKETHIQMQLALNENAELEKPKPEEIVKKMVEGRMKKILKETCLLDQAFVKDGDLSVAQYVENCAKALGKDVKVTAFVRYQVGEGIEKKQSNLAEEVAAMNAK